MAKGGLILLADFVLIALVLITFDLDEIDPLWQAAFAFIALGAIPIYGFYLVLSGVFRAIRRKA